MKNTITSENKTERAMNEIVICLCPTCARQFFNSPNHVIKRINPTQTVKDTCTYCDVRPGYDFRITEKKKRMGDEYM